MQYTDRVLQKCALETYMILSTHHIIISLILKYGKLKIKQYKYCKFSSSFFLFFRPKEWIVEDIKKDDIQLKFLKTI